MNADRGGPVINASELGEFAYCQRAWWLSRVKGLRSTTLAAMASGRALHAAHGRQARSAVLAQQLAIPVFVFALVFMAIGIYLLITIVGG